MKEKPVGRREPGLPARREPAAVARVARGGGRAPPKELDETDARARRRAGRRGRRRSRRRPCPAGRRSSPWRSAPRNGTRALIQGNDFSIIATDVRRAASRRATPTPCASRRSSQGITALRLEALTFDELPRGGPGRDPQGRLRRLRDGGQGRRRPAVALRNATRVDARRRRAFTPAAAIDGNDVAGRLGACSPPTARTIAWWSRRRSPLGRRRRDRRSRSCSTRTRARAARSAGSASPRRPTRGRSARDAGPGRHEGDRGHRGQGPARSAATERRTRSRGSTAAWRPSSSPLAPGPARRRAAQGRASRSASRSRLVTTAAGARTRCASCRAATGWTSPARSWSRPSPHFLPPARDGGTPGDAPRPRALAHLAATTRSPRASS